METAGNAPIQGGGHREEYEDTLAQHVLQSVDVPPSLPTSQSYDDILAGMNAGVAATLAIPLMVAHGVTSGAALTNGPLGQGILCHFRH